MSSFYGQMRWQDFQQFFLNFTLENKHFSANNLFNESPLHENQATITSGVKAYIQPNEDFATFQFNAANHWIKFSPIDSQGDTKTTYVGVSIFHNSPDPINPYTLPIFDIIVPPSGSTIEELQSGECFKIACPAFDKAGHFIGEDYLEPRYFKMPEQIIQINKEGNDLILNSEKKFHFANEDGLIELLLNDQKDKLTFQHKSTFTDNETPNFTPFLYEGSKDGTQYQVEVTLQPGDYISTYTTVYDKAGHLVSLKKIYYQLPISEVDSRLEVLENTVKEIQKDIIEIELDVVQLSTDLDNTIKDIQRANEMVGTDAEFGRGDQSSKENSFNAWVKAYIGTTSNYQSLSGALAEVLKKMCADNVDLDNEMRNFYSRITAIEDYLDGKFTDYEPPKRS